MSSQAQDESQRQEERDSSHSPVSLETLVHTRHSIRFFKPEPVPKPLLLECLALATRAPSNSNIQPWRLHLATGPRRAKIISLLQTAASSGPPCTPPLPSHLKHFRSEFGHLLYGPQGYDISRDQPQKQKEATKRNYAFFDAPTIGVVSMPKGLEMVDAMSVGMFLQTFMLALVEKGAGCCLQVSVVGYPEAIREGFGLEEEGLDLLCGIAIGWPDQEQQVNRIVVPREQVERCVTFLE